jgi:acetyl esterase/lipase
MRALLAAGALLFCAISASSGTFTTIPAIEYESVDGKPLLMDLRVPDDDALHPVILFLHSGAWISGDRAGGPAIRQASRGYAVASIDYRLAPQYIWPAPLEDCKAAVRWLRANAPRYRLDPNRVAVFGASAGGHLAAMLATTANHPEFEGLELGNPQFSSAVKAVIDFYGPTDLLKLDAQKLPCYPGLNGNAPYMPPSLLLGCPIQECKDKAETANPINYITASTPPFLIMHGMLDCLVPWQQSQILRDALTAKGVDASLVLLPTAQHADNQFNQPVYQQLVDEFLDRTLRPARRRGVRSSV